MLEGLPPNARIGTWVSNGIGCSRTCRTSQEFVAAVRKINNGKVPTARALVRLCVGYGPARWSPTRKRRWTRVKLAHALGKLYAAAGRGTDARQGFLRGEAIIN